jgi:hypothetical protein
LDNQYAGQIERGRLAAFFAPKAQERLFVLAHDGPGIRAANELATKLLFGLLCCRHMSNSCC